MFRLAIALAALLLPGTVCAQGVGFVGGGTIDPEQFYVGTFFETPRIAQNVRVRPGVDGAWGEGLRVASINLDVIFRTDVPSGWQFYTGGGPTILITRVTDPSQVTDRRFEDDLTGGLGALLGFAHTSGFLAEFKFGRARNDSSLKLGAGFKFGGGP
jgi:hypothetical protein